MTDRFLRTSFPLCALNQIPQAERGGAGTLRLVKRSWQLLEGGSTGSCAGPNRPRRVIFSLAVGPLNGRLLAEGSFAAYCGLTAPSARLRGEAMAVGPGDGISRSVGARPWSLLSCCDSTVWRAPVLPTLKRPRDASRKRATEKLTQVREAVFTIIQRYASSITLNFNFVTLRIHKSFRS